MRSLINFIIRFHFLILFIIFEVIAVGLAIQYNHYQKASFVNFSRKINYFYFDKIAGFRDYWSLRKANEMLSIENANLRNKMISAFHSNELVFKGINDSIYSQKYQFTPARVINNSTNKHFNYITLNKGEENGIKPDMGVISPNGVIGIIVGVSSHFSTAISLLNPNMKLSVKIKKNDYFGSLSWERKSYQVATLRDIPHHVKFSIGDTIVTSGYSSIFPEGILVGTIESYKENVENFHEIEVTLSSDFKNLTHVEIIANLMKEEQIKLEEELVND